MPKSRPDLELVEAYLLSTSNLQLLLSRRTSSGDLIEAIDGKLSRPLTARRFVHIQRKESSFSVVRNKEK